MTQQRTKFAKRQREMDLKDKARQKEERRAAKRSEVRTGKGPPIAWDELAPPSTDAGDAAGPGGAAASDTNTSGDAYAASTPSAPSTQSTQSTPGTPGTRVARGAPPRRGPGG